jgi:ABC-type enterochelin transport system substrate-binding protein
MKRILAFILVVLMLLPLATACGQSELKIEETVAAQTETQAETQAETVTAQTEEGGMIPQNENERNIVRILVIGNSGSKDVFLQLGRVFKAQGFGGKKYTLGFLYLGGCMFYQHVAYAKNNTPKYDYCVTDSENY